MNKKEYLERFLDAWEKCPEYTLTELVYAVWDREESAIELYEMSDDTFISRLEEFANAEKFPHTIDIKGRFSGIKTVEARDMIEAHDKVFSLIQEGLSDAGLDMEDIYTEPYRGDE